MDVTARRAANANRVAFSELLVALVLSMSFSTAGQSQKSDGPPMPFVDAGACPFEGCTYGEWTANDTLAVRRSRDGDAPVVFRLAKGEKVTAVTGDVIVLRPGRVEFREASDLASRDGTIRARPGDTLYLLSYIGDGFTNAWFKGRIYREVDGAMAFFNALCDGQPSRCTGKIVEPTRSEWWIQLRSTTGRIGWTNEPEKFER